LAADTADVYLYFGSREGELTELMLHINRIKPKVELTLEIVVATNEGTAHLVRRCGPVSATQSSGHTMAFGQASVANVAMTFGILTQEEVAAIRMLARARRAELHFVGLETTEKWRVAADQLRSIRQVIETYEVLNGAPWKGVTSRPALSRRPMLGGAITMSVPGCE
jgi:hypothetical protein